MTNQPIAVDSCQIEGLIIYFNGWSIIKSLLCLIGGIVLGGVRIVWLCWVVGVWGVVGGGIFVSIVGRVWGCW